VLRNVVVVPLACGETSLVGPARRNDRWTCCCLGATASSLGQPSADAPGSRANATDGATSSAQPQKAIRRSIYPRYLWDPPASRFRNPDSCAGRLPRSAGLLFCPVVHWISTRG